MTRDPPLQLLHEGVDRRVPGIQQEHLLGGDYGLNVLQIDDYGPLTTQDRGRIGEERVEYPEVTGRQTGAAHDRVLSRLHHLGLPGGVQQEPGPDAGALLPEGGGGN